ncbi:MAG TPA: alpha/beta hydrolase [Frankiaceae bacterium]|nr:alpha/beta hydrolase [Frankiaceae bacterium]
MPLLPALASLADAIAAAPARPAAESVDEARTFAHAMADRTFRDLADEVAPVWSERELLVPSQGREIPVRIYRPRPGVLPVHVYFHGGGFWLGTLDQSDASCRRLAASSDRVVLSVGYHLAPEQKFPVQVEECYAAVCWTADHAAELDIDPARLTIGGASAGGALAAAAALMARDRSGPAICLQLLEIPVTDLTMSQPSIEENAAGPVLTRSSVAQYVGLYLADPADATQPYASPLLAPDLAGLPPAFVTTAEFDPLRDEGEAYARRLAEAGVRVQLTRWGGHFHGSFTMSKLIPDESAAYSRALVEALRAAAPADPPTDLSPTTSS